MGSVVICEIYNNFTVFSGVLAEIASRGAIIGEGHALYALMLSISLRLGDVIQTVVYSIASN